MNRFKFFSVVLSAAIAAGIVFACNKKEDPEAEGKAAGTEMCACVDAVESPGNPPQHPSAPLPPAGFNPQNPDLTNPDVLAYVSHPDIIAYFAAMAVFYQAFEEYADKLSLCLGVIGPYGKYIEAAMANYDPSAADPLYSVFNFKDKDFAKGFKEGTSGCKNAFDALFALMGGQ